MKTRVIPAFLTLVTVGLIFVAAGVSGGCRHHRVERAPAGGAEANTTENIAPSDAAEKGKDVVLSIVDKGDSEDDSRFPAREEIRRAYKLSPGANVSVSGINGVVNVETADTAVAEVLIVRLAKTREDLQYRKINISQSAESLVIRVENDHKSIWSAFGERSEGRQRVTLKLPRKIDFESHGINGQLTTGAIDGSVGVRGINGKVKIGQLSGSASLNGVNGDSEIIVAKLLGEGLEIGGVNGNTDVEFVGEVNAEVEARGMNGRVDPDLPNVEVKSGLGYGRYSARIGNGGARIEVHGVNGNVFLKKADKPMAASKK